MIKNLHFIVVFLLTTFVCFSQATINPGVDVQKSDRIGQQFLQDELQDLGLTATDIANMDITNIYINKNNGWTQLYYTQTHNGFQVKNAVLNLTIKPDGTVVHYGNRFVADLESKVDSDVMLLSAEEAIIRTALDLGLEGVIAPTPLKEAGEFGKQYYTAPYALEKITAQPKYDQTADGHYRIAWQVYLAENNSADTWYTYVDAITGEIISKRNNTIYCNIEHGRYHNHTAECRHHHQEAVVSSEAAMGDGSKYRVFALPTESPIHGPHVIVEDPSLEVASPYGWHDVNAQDGAEYTITRGNNVWAYEDSGNNNGSVENEPEGGDDLNFDFPYDPRVNPFNNMEADVTNMFYMCNMIHDMTNLIGFDSAAGAFQDNTYGTGGRGRDPVRAEALDGSGIDNANFATPDDGSSGRMQMYRWVFADLFRVLEPSNISGSYTTSEGTWVMTPDNLEIDITGELVVVADSDPQRPELGCGELENDVNGKIAIIFRGVCQFGTKALNAENAGAVAAIICNVPGVNGGDGETAMGMAAGDDGNEVTIPVLSLANSDCVRIVQEMADGPVTAQLKILDEGPGEVSSGFDNGVIAHEYGHGISNRLFGGPSLAGCLGNGEQMGEGISDYVALIMTAKEGDKGTDARGVGNFSDGQGPNGRGIRRFQYSTDMDICPLTYDDISGQGVHAMGEVWAATLWDIYWAFTDLYGWTDDWSDETAGNVRAMKLAMDGMKMAPCSPGFIDTRDAIFAADGGEHECLLWEIFARRGLGFFADQGSPNSNTDGTEDFEPKPTCITTLKIKRDVATLVFPGDDLDVTIDIANHTEQTAENVIITDVLDTGLNIKDGSASVPYTVSGNMVLFEIGTMEYLDEMTITYTLTTDPNITSVTKIINSAETQEEAQEWELDLLGSVNTNYWDRTQLDSYKGDVSWLVRERDGDSDQRLIFKDLPIIGDRPALRFWHRPNCIPVDNGGFVEVSRDGVIWEPVDDLFLRGGYNNPITYANLALPGLNGYSGSSDGFRDAYIELDTFLVQNVNKIDVRFRFATYDIDPDDFITFDSDNGWFVDDLELMDIKTYVAEASISADNAETITDGKDEIVIDSDGIEDGTGTEDLIEGVTVAMAPNPASDNVTVKISSDRNLTLNVSLVSIDGRQLKNETTNIYENDNYINMDVSGFASGFYLLQLRSGNKMITKKLIIE